ncbi:MAG: heavy metal translocating P-type ATPase [Elusimicrobiales bacterium]
MMPETAPPGTRRAALPVEGMHCSACASRIESALGALPGVEEASVNLPNRRVYVAYRPETVSPEVLRAAVEKLGYKVPSGQGEGAAEAALARETASYGLRFLAAACGAAAILSAGYFSLSQYTVWLIATAVWAWSGAHFHAGFARASKAFAPDMDMLVSMSSGAAYFYSAALTLFPDWFARGSAPLWGEMALLIAFINFGRWLESRARGGAGAAVARLLRMSPKFARVIENGREITVRAAEVRPGQLLAAGPGEQFAADGTVEKGVSSADESLLTGESLPADKLPGSRVFGGTLNRHGYLEYRAASSGADTALSRIVTAVRQAQNARPPARRAADAAARWFVPAVFVAAVAAGLLWVKFGGDFAFSKGVSVFVAVLAVACPCALGLAVPMALAVGLDRAAGMGILIRSHRAAETAHSLDVVAIDKTGTLTSGDITVEKLLPSGCDGEFLLSSALIAESASEHPFAAAVRAHAQKLGVLTQKPDSAQSFPGSGIKARFGSEEILAGRPDWLAQNGVQIPHDTLAPADNSELAVARGGKFLGLIALGDALRPSARPAVEKLKGLGLEVVLISGDRHGAVAAAARQAGIEQYYAGVLPEGKAAAIAELQSRGRRVAMVGDGFNDAPALSRADIGIALSTGTDVAMEAADITIMRPSLAAVCDALVLSRAVRRVMLQNIAWAFGYNALLVPLAAGAFYPHFGILLPPSSAGAAMALSSLTVVFNSLRLRNIKI